MTKTAPLLAALGELDPAARSALTPEEQQRADATLARVLASDPAAGPAPVADRRPRRARVLVPAGVAAAAAAVAVPVLVGSSGAYAGWEPTPERLSPATADAATETCLDRSGVSTDGARTLVAESRGEWTYVTARTPDRELSCFLPDELVGERLGQDETRFFGRVGDEVTPGVSDPRLVREDASGVGATGDDDTFTFVEGRVGADVESVTIVRESGTDVVASVANGRFAAWWPSGNASNDPGTTGDFSVEATLTDGTVVTPRR